MKNLLAVGFLAAAALGGPLPSADDVSLRIVATGRSTPGPLASLIVRNRGTNPQAGVVVQVFAESETGLELWSGTVDVPAGGTARLAARVYLDQDTTVLAATATLAGAEDANPSDNAGRAALGFGGGAGRALVGRSIHLARCASCHGQEAGGGAAPALVGTTAAAILAEAAAGGDHDFPWLSRAEARSLRRFYRDPAGVRLPPPLPPRPPGGWPTYSGSVKALLDDRCLSCHRAGFARYGIRLDAFGPAAANARRALRQVRSGLMPQGGKRFDPDEVALIRDWIDGGRRP